MKKNNISVDFDLEMDLIREYSKSRANIRNKCGYDPSYNSRGRDALQKEMMLELIPEVMAIDLVPEDIEIQHGGQNGPDSAIPKLGINANEHKSQWQSTKTLTENGMGRGVFDKQHDPVRRNALSIIDMYTFSTHSKIDEEIMLGLMVIGKENMKPVHKIIKQKQKEYLDGIDSRSEDSRIEDRIHLPTIEVIEALDNNQMIISFNGIRVNKDYLFQMVENKTPLYD